MGSWGTGIFQDDFALDVRGAYREMVSLKFADEPILAELQQKFGKAEDIDESTFWIALALAQHQSGRLDEGVKAKALHFIDSGRALNHWVELAEEGDSSIPSRNKQLQKARSTIVSLQPKRKTGRPSKELRERIDRTYSSFPWKEGGLYASGDGGARSRFFRGQRSAAQKDGQRLNELVGALVTVIRTFAHQSKQNSKALLERARSEIWAVISSMCPTAPSSYNIQYR